MAKYLDGYLSIIPANQKQRIIDLIQNNKTKYNLSITEEEFTHLIASIAEKHEKLSQYVEQSGRIDSTVYNAAMSKIAMDLQVLFSEVNLLSKAQENYSTLGKAMLSDLKHEINKLEGQVAALESSIVTSETMISKNETFDTIANMESTDSPLYDGIPAVEVSTRNKDHIVTLKQIGQDYVETNRVREKPDIVVTKRVGLPTNTQVPKCSTTDIKHIISDWNETVVSLAPLDLNMDLVHGPGAIAKLQITFPSPQLISCISITPSGASDIEIAGIAYQTELDLANSNSILHYKYIAASTSITAHTEVTSLCTPDTYTSSSTITFTFPSVIVKQVIIYIRQPNYAQERLTQPVTIGDSSVTFEQGYANACVYTYGIKSMEISSLKYGEKACFVSKPYNIDRNIALIRLTAVERHPVLLADENIPENDVSERDTSIEYYITSSDGAVDTQWYAIMPDGEDEVKNELLVFNGTHADLRFKANNIKEMVVFKNGIRISDNEWSKLQTDKTTISINIGFDPNAIYTVDYYPEPSAYSVSLANSYITQFIDPNVTYQSNSAFGEVFHGTDNNKTVALSKYPYVNYEAINQDSNYNPNLGIPPIQVYFENAFITGPNRTTLNSIAPYPTNGVLENNTVYTKNITDYTDPDKQYVITPYDPSTYRFIEYYHKDNKIFFGETFKYKDNPLNVENSHGSGDIRVRYSYPVTSIRTKIILRRYTYADEAVTPELSNYMLKVYTRK